MRVRKGESPQTEPLISDALTGEYVERILRLEEHIVTELGQRVERKGWISLKVMALSKSALSTSSMTGFFPSPLNP